MLSSIETYSSSKKGELMKLKFKNKPLIKIVIIGSPLLILITLIITCSCFSPRNLKHVTFPLRPRIAFPINKLKNLQNNKSKEHKQIIKRADKLLKTELFVPEKGGQWIFYYACPKDNTRLKTDDGKTHFCPKCKTKYDDARTKAAYITILNSRLENQMYNLALAYAITKDNKYALPVKKAFLKLTQIYPTLGRHDRWGRTGILAVVGGRRYCQHLSEAAAVIKLAKTYDLCADASIFTMEERKRIEDDFLGAVVREIQNYEFFVGRKNNHQTWFNAAYANVGLSIGDPKLINDAVYGTGGLLWQLTNSVTDDGIWYEGTMSYHFYALNAIINTLKALECVGWKFSKNKRLKSLWSGPLAMAFPDGTIPAMNDGDPTSIQQWKSYYKFAYRYFDDPVFANIAGINPDNKKVVTTLGSTNLSHIGLAILREKTGSDAVCSMLDYGVHGDHHGHPDKLNLVFYALGREIALDPGRISYSVPAYNTWCRTTVAHNTVVINKTNQKPTTGKLLFFQQTQQYSTCYAKTNDAYPGYKLARFLLLYDGVLIDVFKIEGDSKALIDWVIHTRGQLKVKSNEKKNIKSIGLDNGYQHLKSILGFSKEGWIQFDVTQPDGQWIGIHLFNEKKTKVYTGTGIGCKLTEKVPFILRRKNANATVFITCYDFSGNGTMVTNIKIGLVKNVSGQVLKSSEAIAITVKGKNTLTSLAFDLREKNTDKLFFQGIPFKRILFKQDMPNSDLSNK